MEIQKTDHKLLYGKKNIEKSEKKELTKGFVCSIMWKLLRERRNIRKKMKKNLKKVLDKSLLMC